MTDDLIELAERVEAALPYDGPEPWFFHNGGGRPHSPSCYVQVQMRCGHVEDGHSADFLWPWDADDPREEDILKFRVVPERTSIVTLGRLIADNAGIVAAALRARGAEQ